MDNEKSYTVEEMLEAYLKSLKSTCFGSIQLLPSGMSASQEALRTVANNIAKQHTANREIHTDNLKTLFFDCPCPRISATTASSDAFRTITNNIANASQLKHEEFEKLFYDSLDKNSK